MRIGLVSTVSGPVRREDTGSVESLVCLLAVELVRLGHAVTVFGAAGSEVPGPFVETVPGPYGRNGAPGDWHVCEWINLARAIEASASFDVLHAQAYLWSLPLESQSRAAMVHTLHVWPDETAEFLRSRYPDAVVTAPSHCQWSGFPACPPAAVIPHAVDPADFALGTDPDDYVCYLGRFTSGKGPKVAVQAARSVGVKLVLMGPSSPYFRDEIAPLVDGRTVDYVGAVSGRRRSDLLGRARALLYPVQYEEPFGLVLVEAMMCGTPVVALRLGAVEEIVEEGVSGYTASSFDEFSAKIRPAFGLNRRRIRERAEERFSPERMARAYMTVYEAAIRGWRR